MKDKTSNRLLPILFVVFIAIITISIIVHLDWWKQIHNDELQVDSINVNKVDTVMIPDFGTNPTYKNVIMHNCTDCTILEGCKYIYLNSCHNVIVEKGSNLYLKGVSNRRYSLLIDSTFEDGEYFDDKGYWIWHEIEHIEK